MKKLLLLLFLMFLFTACSLFPLVEETLVFSVIPADTPELTRQYWQPIADYLTERIGRTVELKLVQDYTAVVEGLIAEHIQIARMSAAPYILAVEEGANIVPIVAGVKKKTGLAGYYSHIIVRSDSNIETIDDVDGRTFAFVEVKSTSGYVVPSYALNKADVTPSEVFMAGSHAATIAAVQNGTVDAGACASNRWDAALREGVIADGELRIVWTSPLVPTPPIVVHGSLELELQKAIQDAFLEMPPALLEAVETLGMSYYTAVTDGDYDIIRELEAYKNK